MVKKTPKNNSKSHVSRSSASSSAGSIPRARPVSVLGSVGEFTSSSPLRPASVAAERPMTSSATFHARPSSVIGTRLMSVKANDNGNIKVVVRARPLLDREAAKAQKCVISMNHADQSTLITPQDNNPRRNNEPKKFYFDRSFWSVDSDSPHYADQNIVYNEIAKEFLDHNFEGYNTCIFAYGQTGSGKTFTMMGNKESEGIIPRTCRELFERIDQKLKDNTSSTVRISYFEVYNEQVRDLLVPITNKSQPARHLRVRESPTEGPYVEDLLEYIVKDAEQVMKYIQQGNRNRVTAATNMNDQSSRSHAVVTLNVKQVHYSPDSDATEEKTSQLRLVDLAGSERANATGATGVRLKEGSNINKSLSTLGRVIASLASPSQNHQLVPYRDSVLTWLLKESLGGNSRTAMVACVSPVDYEETLSTLRYADQAKRIKTRAVVNQDIVSGADRDKIVEEMQQQIAALQSSLNSHQKQEEDQFKSELHKVRQAIKFYEDRAITEEHKRRAAQTEKLAVSRHNKMLIDHLREVTNRAGGNMGSAPTKDCYEELKRTQQDILGDLGSAKQNLQATRQRLNAEMEKLSVIY